MRTFSLVLLGLAVGAALLSRSPNRPAPTPPEPAASAPALADLETLEFWEQGSYIQPISRTCLTRTPEGTRVELELYHEEVYQEQAGPELLEQASIAAGVSSAPQPITSIGTGAESLFESMSCYASDSFSGLFC